MTEFMTPLQKIQSTYAQSVIKITRPSSEFPELVIEVPDWWDEVKLAPLYDVHIGSPQHDKELFEKHRSWIATTPNVLTWNGGDMFENITPAEAKMGHTAISPEEQLYEATRQLAPIRHKMLFSLPGNHEDRTSKSSGMSSAARLADYLNLPYFSDYCFCLVKWRGNNFRLLAHHGAGGAQTPGAQLNSARKELAWTNSDLYWTGHLHQSKTDVAFRVDYDQSTGAMYDRKAVVKISPSYVMFWWIRRKNAPIPWSPRFECGNSTRRWPDRCQHSRWRKTSMSMEFLLVAIEEAKAAEKAKVAPPLVQPERKRSNPSKLAVLRETRRFTAEAAEKATKPPSAFRLGEILVKEGLITQDQLSKALKSKGDCAEAAEKPTEQQMNRYHRKISVRHYGAYPSDCSRRTFEQHRADASLHLLYDGQSTNRFNCSRI